MAPKQRMRIANERATKNITLRGNVPKSSVKSCDKVDKLIARIMTFVIVPITNCSITIVCYYLRLLSELNL
ncbi:hypothetical protein E2986_11076 [Frieseomelitta varia]|uniref:Uncharacterized protein n=1 Tax=Frieseomelitta varia TaxID=561572 RepID=A0A833SAJ2_9HYME|nr:hypothetical protein E2986_11076 [Frieseomelitta varia]